MSKLKNIASFVFQKKFLMHYGAAILLIIIILSGVFFALNISTHHGETLSVPDFSGMTVKQATKTAEAKNLRIEVIDSVYNGPGRRGTIIDQNPPPDIKVKENRRIFVTIKSVLPKIIKMPNFVHATLVQAKADIETYGLRIGELTYEPSIFDNVVLKQKYKHVEIKPGTDIPQGAEIELVLGKSQDMGNTVTPDLYGLTLEEAELEAADFMLNIGTALYDESVKTHDDSVYAKVIRQRPEPGIVFQPGEEIDLWLSLKSDSIKSE
ncbi:MAG: PASTA domain-containing protein [Chlorobi bacterium]|nr:PASTA domain-containing protein [Chlorobiota bacterium]